MPFNQFFLPGISENTSLLKEGWRSPEENRIWSIGLKARIILPLYAPHLRPTLYMIYKMSAFVVTGKYDQQKVNILVNDKLIGNILLKTNDFVPLVFALPNKVINERKIDVVIETPDCMSPAELQMSSDSDKLGVCISFFAIVSDAYCARIRSNSFLEKFSSLEEYKNVNAKNLQVNNDRFIYEQILTDKARNPDQWKLTGHCLACRKEANFSVFHRQGERTNYREQLICSSCKLKSRQRALIQLVHKHIENQPSIKKIFLYERVGLFFQFFVDQWKSVETVGSEYLGKGFLSGQEYDGIRHEDALDLSFENESFDILVSCDVFEHVPDIKKAFIEAYRILADGGILYFTVPFNNKKSKTRKRAQLTDGNLDFFAPPEYHGNPIDSNGSLVFYDISWDIIDVCLRSGFKDAYAVSFWGPDNGYLGVGELLVFVAKK